MIKIIRYLTLVFVLFCHYNLLGQKYVVDDIPKKLLEESTDIIRYQKTEFIVKSPDNATELRKIAITINDKSSQRNIYRVGYDDYSKIKKISGTLYNANGIAIRKIKKKDIQDVSGFDGISLYTDYRLKIVSLTHNEYPYTVEFEVEKEHLEIQDYPDWYILPDYDVAVEDSWYILSIPNKMNVHYKNYNTELQPDINKMSATTTYTWKATAIAPIAKEIHSPPYYEVLPSIHLIPSTFKVKSYTGSMNSWQDFGNFMYNLNKGRDELSPEMKTKVQELTANAQTDKEKIDQLYRYLQENTRYVSVQLGIGGWQTFDAQYVEKNKYGDCKALTNFMKSMLKEANIKAFPVLINSGKSFEHDQTFAEPNFNHVILNVPSENYWLECTSSYSPSGYITSGNENKTALLISENESKLIKTPKIKNSGIEQNIVLQLSDTGDATIVNQAIFKGRTQEKLRYLSNAMSPDDQKEYLRKRLNLSTFKVNDLDILPKKQKPETVLAYTLYADKYASKAGNRLFVPLNKIDNINYVPKEIKDRKLPVHLKNNYTLESVTTMHIPEGFEIESLPNKPINIRSKFGTYSLKITQQGHQVLVHRTFKQNAITSSADTYQEFREFYKKVSTTENIEAVLVKKK